MPQSTTAPVFVAASALSGVVYYIDSKGFTWEGTDGQRQPSTMRRVALAAGCTREEVCARYEAWRNSVGKERNT